MHELTNLIDNIVDVRSGESEVLKGANNATILCCIREKSITLYAESFEPNARGMFLDYCALISKNLNLGFPSLSPYECRYFEKSQLRVSTSISL